MTPLSSLSLSSPRLLPPPKPRALPASLLPGTLIYRTPKISYLAPGSSALQSPHCNCSSSDPTSMGKIAPSARIFVKGLSSSTSEGCLAKTFSCFGEVCKVKIITSRTSKQSLGLAYIWFACEENAQLAVKEMDGKFFDGRFIAVLMARPESPSSHNPNQGGRDLAMASFYAVQRMLQTSCW